MFGKLTLADIPYHEPIILVTFIVVALGGLGLVGAISYFGKWGYLWKEWLTTVDHKKIGVMYFIVALIMLLRGFSDAILMRSQQAIASGGAEGYLPPHHYDQIFTAHGVIMIFFVAMPFVAGLMNVVTPLQIGARDVAFPFLNSLSFWLFVAGAVLIMMSLFVGEFAATGWVAYPPLSGIQYSPGVGMDYYIWALQLSGIGTTLTGVNFFVTVLKMRTKGMTLMRMPIFTWTSWCTAILIMAAFPILTVTLALLTLDRYLGFHFFTAEAGGNQMMYTNLIWAWGHPEVYILILPAFGVFSEVTSTFSKKRLFGYVSMVWATVAITVLSFIVWLHHFFTMGSGANVNAFFGIATMIIAIPTGVKIFTWLFTMYQGRIQFTSPMLWTLGFIVTFSIGGMTGVLLAVPGADFVLHNSLFLIAHFHNVIIGGAVFGYFAGMIYWFPKVFGFKLNEKLNKQAFWCWLIGFYVAFMPLYMLGFMGMTRRLNHYDNPDWHPFLVTAAIGAGIIALGILSQLWMFYVSIRDRNLPENVDVTGDPWDGRTLEWSTSSPPPFYNFAEVPEVHDIDAYWGMKEKGITEKKDADYKQIHMPRNTGAGIVISLFALILGFALIWHIWWLAIASFVGCIVTAVVRSYDDDVDYYVPAEEVARIETARIQSLAKLKQA
ncbi:MULTISPECIES: cytochrome o ubiquinol oxidase subunit I [Pseudomonadaceae]|jgi:cytochrome o ubiquinol oxidase subunit 1|uniref:Cytochrome bo(3) ubiquinol oxidase subunit 1 n=2 Tax=Pseudomonadaceae TaxID=135621 RepID=A0A1G5NC36_9PSED|nr:MULTISPECIES: cytochrome o ubiquinol oxidase subunit I [Pseudomonas]EHK70880.1 cytochrome o ubiquinol oxidase subunit I [Pseudomonas psychrotolerans L19]KIZ51164.1 cytochrome o ubiquinol oxidase subunit I [Pseudomonas oryzihabitans]KTT53441.1 cytochrome o ubiquinol oxidase subunit I [Pseudomonas psychrotolerans]MBA1259371.1 cytochrome o ubiquinol oxidase subunit I [Pseudomonas psychrotolerans]MBH3331082.1 cytochrome o ubiquinol oxidase subunit I [Pseudomonas oryzihabitans]